MIMLTTVTARCRIHGYRSSITNELEQKFNSKRSPPGFSRGGQLVVVVMVLLLVLVLVEIGRKNVTHVLFHFHSLPAGGIAHAG